MKKRYSIRLQSGGFWDFQNPEESVFTIEDIAHNLSKEPRYNGANDGPRAYSVAQHGVNASLLAAPGFEFEALHHDDAEFAYKDVTTWLKRLIPDYRGYLEQGEALLAKYHGLPAEMSPEVKLVDLQMLRLEKEALFANPNIRWNDGGFSQVETIDVAGLESKVDLEPWPPHVAKGRWLRRHYKLLENRNG